MKKISQLVVGAFASVATSLSFAAILFEHQFPVDGDSSLPYCSSCTGQYQVFDQFKLASDADISRIDARLFLDRTSSLTYLIFDASRTNQLYSQAFQLSSLTVNSVQSQNFAGYDVSASFTDLRLEAGTYFLSILGNSAAQTAWFSSPVIVDGKSVQTLNGNIAGGGNGKDEAFRIIGAVSSSEVPEPATLTLFGLGIFGLVVMRRKAIKE